MMRGQEMRGQGMRGQKKENTREKEPLKEPLKFWNIKYIWFKKNDDNHKKYKIEKIEALNKKIDGTEIGLGSEVIKVVGWEGLIDWELLKEKVKEEGNEEELKKLERFEEFGIYHSKTKNKETSISKIIDKYIKKYPEVYYITKIIIDLDFINEKLKEFLGEIGDVKDKELVELFHFYVISRVIGILRNLGIGKNLIRIIQSKNIKIEIKIKPTNDHKKVVKVYEILKNLILEYLGEELDDAFKNNMKQMLWEIETYYVPIEEKKNGEKVYKSYQTILYGYEDINPYYGIDVNEIITKYYEEFLSKKLTKIADTTLWKKHIYNKDVIEYAKKNKDKGIYLDINNYAIRELIKKDLEEGNGEYIPLFDWWLKLLGLYRLLKGKKDKGIGIRTIRKRIGTKRLKLDTTKNGNFDFEQNGFYRTILAYINQKLQESNSQKFTRIMLPVAGFMKTVGYSFEDFYYIMSQTIGDIKNNFEEDVILAWERANPLYSFEAKNNEENKEKEDKDLEIKLGNIQITIPELQPISKNERKKEKTIIEIKEEELLDLITKIVEYFTLGYTHFYRTFGIETIHKILDYVSLFNEINIIKNYDDNSLYLKLALKGKGIKISKEEKKEYHKIFISTISEGIENAIKTFYPKYLRIKERLEKGEKINEKDLKLLGQIADTKDYIIIKFKLLEDIIHSYLDLGYFVNAYKKHIYTQKLEKFIDLIKENEHIKELFKNYNFRTIVCIPKTISELEKINKHLKNNNIVATILNNKIVKRYDEYIVIIHKSLVKNYKSENTSIVENIKYHLTEFLNTISIITNNNNNTYNSIKYIVKKFIKHYPYYIVPILKEKAQENKNYVKHLLKKAIKENWGINDKEQGEKLLKTLSKNLYDWQLKQIHNFYQAIKKEHISEQENPLEEYISQFPLLEINKDHLINYYENVLKKDIETNKEKKKLYTLLFNINFKYTNLKEAYEQYISNSKNKNKNFINTTFKIVNNIANHLSFWDNKDEEEWINYYYSYDKNLDKEIPIITDPLNIIPNFIEFASYIILSHINENEQKLEINKTKSEWLEIFNQKINYFQNLKKTNKKEFYKLPKFIQNFISQNFGAKYFLFKYFLHIPFKFLHHLNLIHLKSSKKYNFTITPNLITFKNEIWKIWDNNNSQPFWNKILIFHILSLLNQNQTPNFKHKFFSNIKLFFNSYSKIFSTPYLIKFSTFSKIYPIYSTNLINFDIQYYISTLYQLQFKFAPKIKISNIIDYLTNISYTISQYLFQNEQIENENLNINYQYLKPLEPITISKKETFSITSKIVLSLNNNNNNNFNAPPNIENFLDFDIFDDDDNDFNI